MPWYSNPQEVWWPTEHQDLVALETEQLVRACIRSLARTRARAGQAGLGLRGQDVVEKAAREGTETDEAMTRGDDCTRAGGNDSARGNDHSGAARTTPLSLSERRLFARWTCYEAYATTPTPRETFEGSMNGSDPGHPAASQGFRIPTNYSHEFESWEASGLPTPPSTPPQPEGAPPSPPLTPPGQDIEGTVTSFHPGSFAWSNTEQRDGKKPFPPPQGRDLERTAETNSRAQTLIVTIEGEEGCGRPNGDVSGLRSERVKRA